MSKMSNEIVKNRASRGQVEDIEVAEPGATQRTEEFEHGHESEANFYRDYVAQQKHQENGAEWAENYCCPFHAGPAGMPAEYIEVGWLDPPTTPQHSTQPEPKRARLVPSSEEDAPTVDAPAVDAPAVDAPTVDAPTVDAPAVDSPAVDAPAVDAPAVDAHLQADNEQEEWLATKAIPSIPCVTELPLREAVEIDELSNARSSSITSPRKDSSELMEAADEDDMVMKDQMDVPPEVKQANAQCPMNMPEYWQELQKEQTDAGSREEEMVLSVKEQRQPADIGDVQPKPQDRAKCRQWLQQSSQILTSQYKSLLWEDRRQAAYNFWPRCDPLKLDDFEDFGDETASEYRDLQANRLISKWHKRFGKGSLQNLCRKLDTKVPAVRTLIKKLSKGKIKPLETQIMRIELKFSRTYCTLQLKEIINLRKAATKLPRVDYKGDINVLQKIENHPQHSKYSRISWLWPNGTLTIINGCREDKADLIHAQESLLAPILNVSRFDAAPGHSLQYLRLRSTAHFGSGVNIKTFAAWFALSTQTFRDELQSKFVYYVTRKMPGVVAELHDHGRVFVYAMSIQKADKMLLKLCNLIHNHRQDLVKVEKQ